MVRWIRKREIRNGGFSFHRLWISFWTDEVRPIEIGLALFFLTVRGTYLLYYGYRHPGVEHFLRTLDLTEQRVGYLCLSAALLHLYAAGTCHQGWRVVASIAGIMLSLTIIVTFVDAAPQWQPIGVIWLSVLLTESYLLLRHFLGPYDESDS